MSTSSGWLMAKATARAKESAGMALRKLARPLEPRNDVEKLSPKQQWHPQFVIVSWILNLKWSK